MPTTEATSDGYALALEEARRALEEQERAVAELRARAGTLIAAAALAASLLGEAPQGLLGVVAVGALIGLTTAMLVVLWPRWDWRFSVAPSMIVLEYLEPPKSSLPFVHRDLAFHMERNAAVNRERLNLLVTTFRTGVLLFAIALIACVAGSLTTT